MLLVNLADGAGDFLNRVAAALGKDFVRRRVHHQRPQITDNRRHVAAKSFLPRGLLDDLAAFSPRLGLGRGSGQQPEEGQQN